VKIVVGLGNPGKRYADTRHNIGWMVIDRIADRAGWGGRGKERDAALVAWGRHAGLDLMLVKPLTFMNESGIAVRKVLARERAPLEDLLVVCDDFALPFGRLRMRGAGSAGTHNGLRSIIGELGSQKFARLRVGIGEPEEQAKAHVLDSFTASERRLLDAVLDAAADAVESWAREGVSRAATRWNPWLLEGDESDRAVRPDAGQAAEAPDAEGVVRRRTGWRRLLPRQDAAGGEGRP
jgi:PTH1 family peptidyl-tRNA hydrolase